MFEDVLGADHERPSSLASHHLDLRHRRTEMRLEYARDRVAVVTCIAFFLQFDSNRQLAAVS
jgi:hypothetical protein